MHKCCTPVSQCFVQEFGLVILKLRYVCTRIEQISKYVWLMNVSHGQGKRLQNERGRLR